MSFVMSYHPGKDVDCSTCPICKSSPRSDVFRDEDHNRFPFIVDICPFCYELVYYITFYVGGSTHHYIHLTGDRDQCAVIEQIVWGPRV